jgi:anaerobic selenocysteine-containing dehydrogenase
LAPRWTTLLAQGFAPLPGPDAPFAEGGFPRLGRANSSARLAAQGLDGLPDHLPNHERRPEGPLPAGHDLAAGAQLPQLQLRQRQSLRDIEGEPLLEMHPDDAAPRHCRRRPVRVFNDRGSYHCQAEVSAPAPAWSTAWASGGASWANGTNVNELTSQRPDRPGPRPHLLRLRGAGQRAGLRRFDAAPERQAMDRA